MSDAYVRIKLIRIVIGIENRLCIGLAAKIVCILSLNYYVDRLLLPNRIVMLRLYCISFVNFFILFFNFLITYLFNLIFYCSDLKIGKKT